jgi:hypothetical protein
MPVYFSGYVMANATPRVGFGGGFAVGRFGVVGSYRITIAAGTYSRFLIPVATPVALHTISRVSQVQKDALTGNYMIDIEIRDLTTNNPVDGDFTFIALERSGP